MERGLRGCSTQRCRPPFVWRVALFNRARTRGGRGGPRGPPSAQRAQPLGASKRGSRRVGRSASSQSWGCFLSIFEKQALQRDTRFVDDRSIS